MDREAPGAQPGESSASSGLPEAETLPRAPRVESESETWTRPPGRARRRAEEAEALSLEPGQEFGAYRLVERIGEGGFGQVWEATSARTGRRVALKLLMAPPSAAREVIARFKREGRLAASLDHPSCLFVFSAEEIEGRPVIAMELMPGGTLRDRLSREGPLPYREAVDCTLQILDGLEAAHAAGVIHRDVKPSNCFLDRSGSVRLGDFGLSRALDVDGELTTAGSFLGTPSYSSPEQVRGRDVDASSDLYSVGATLYALLTGKPPFTGDDGTQVLARILTEPPTPFTAHRAVVPRGLQRVVLRLLAKDKSRRFPDCAGVRAALRPYSSRGLQAASPGGRLIAFAVDTLAIQVTIGLLAGAEYLVQPVTLPYQLALLALTFAYFGLQEGWWGRTVGKRLLGLRVETTSGGAAAPVAIAIRAGVFSGVQYGPIIAWLAAGPAAASPELARSFSFWMLAVLLPYAVLLGTMRRGNGLAALHDLASRTRVRAPAPVRATVPGVASRVIPGGEPSRRTFGPFGEARVVWRAAGESLVVARDPELRRDVWIHTLGEDGGAEAPSSSLVRDRPGLLHWLQGSRVAGDRWDAYEAPSGISLAEWVRSRDRLPWGQMREILLDLAEELEARRSGGEPERPLSIRNVWVDGHGQTRLLDFPADPPRGERADEPPGSDWRGFLHQVLMLGCEGRLPRPEDFGSRTPRVPLPEHVRPLVEGLCGLDQRLRTPGEVASAIAELGGKPPAVTRRRRLGPLVVAAVPGLFMLFSLLFAVLGAPEAVRLAGTLRRSRAALATLSGTGGPPASERVAALRQLQAATFAELVDVSNRSSNPVAVRVAREAVAGLGEAERAAVEARLREPSASPAELAAARLDLEAIEPSASLWGLALAFLLTGLAPLAAPALLLAPPARGGALLWLFGMGLQTRDGQRASRRRSLFRAVVAWAPYALFALWQPWAVLHVIFPLVLTVGVACTLACPERGIPDRIAGTHLVPR